MANETRDELLKELAEYATPGFVNRAARLCTDEQLRARIESAKAQLKYYTDAGFEDKSKSAS